MTTPNEELIARLRLHDDDRLYREADDLMSEAADLLQSQAERIAYLEADRNLEKKMRKDADEYAETLRAQLEQIGKAEPVAWFDMNGIVRYTVHQGKPLKAGDKLFTRPMPADVTELVEALEQMIACHDEPTCPAIDVARAALSKYKGAK